MSKKSTDINKNDVSLDEILSSIRSVVMDETTVLSDKAGKESTKKSPSKKYSPPSKSLKKTVKKNRIDKKSSVKGEATTNFPAYKAQNSSGKKTKTASVKNPKNLPVKSYLLTNIVEMGREPDSVPIITDLCQHKVEESIYDLMDIITANKDSLPKEFYDKQDVVIEAWLNQYLPQIVEKQVQQEIRRIGLNIIKNS